MKKTLIFLFVGMFLISLASASTQESLGTFKQGDCVDLKQSCASCSYVNFTRVINPDGTQALGNVQADKDGSIFNYTYCNASALGTYIVYGIGDVDSTDTVFAYTFDATPTGHPTTTPNTLMYGIVLFFIFIAFCFSFYGFLIIPWGHFRGGDGTIIQVNNDRTKKIGLFFLSYILAIVFLFIMRTMTESFMFLDDTPFLFDAFFMILLISIFPVIIAVIALWIMVTISDTKLQEAVFRGYKG